ncbi:MAG TPA: WYL domain-containing protein [Beutenbergiaceae bacterium]|nr:WYL domain-containing protein [Beutenbergiaceae bacterium]
MAETSADRVARLLALVAYLDQHQGVSVAEVAEHFGVSEAQVLKDVDTLWVSGTPGQQHNDLIDFAYSDHEQHILTLIEPQGMDRPLRLGPGEAVALLVALRSLQATEGLPEDRVLASALDKLGAAAGDAARAAQAVDVHATSDEVGDRLATIRTAMQQGRQIQLRYVNAADVVSERSVCALQLLTDSSRWFLHAWCHRVEDLRQFRLDRILTAEILDIDAHEHHDVDLSDSPDPELSTARWRVSLELASRARWVSEQYPVAKVRDLPGGDIAVDLDVVDLPWLRNLVLALGPAVHRVEPPEVAEQIAAHAEAALAAYEQTQR